MSSDTLRRCTVVVLGDLARSPRMLYHARSLGEAGVEVDLVGYVEHPVPTPIAEHPRIRVHPLRASRGGAAVRLPRLAFLPYAAWRAFRQAVGLWWMLLVRVPRPDLVLVQNPPAVPTLMVALVASRLRGARLAVDWHNFGYAMLGLALRPTHPIVRLAEGYERVLGRRADTHLCVSRAMRAALEERWGIPDATVLYDRPSGDFAPTPAHAREALFRRLGNVLDTRLAEPGAVGPALVVSPSSWTADEDYDLLLTALRDLDARLVGSARPPAAPRVVVVLSGDGPLRARYVQRIRALHLSAVAIRPLWLEAQDYPRLLGSADLGLSLHRSASGLDLPMKIADMFGAGVPVCALDYGPCLGEQVHDGETGVLFQDAPGLASALERLLGGFPTETTELDNLRANVAARERLRWPEAWQAAAWPVLR